MGAIDTSQIAAPGAQPPHPPASVADDNTEETGWSKEGVSLEVGNRVMLRGKPGTVAFLGHTQFDPRGVWAGVALDEAWGKNNGSVDGIGYFVCLPNHGLFVRPNKLSLSKPESPSRFDPTI